MNSIIVTNIAWVCAFMFQFSLLHFAKRKKLHASQVFLDQSTPLAQFFSISSFFGLSNFAHYLNWLGGNKDYLYVLTIAARDVSRIICHNKTQSCREVSVCSQSAWKSVPVRHVTGHSNENKLFVIFVIIFYSLHFAPLFRRSVILHRGYPQV